MARAGCFVKGRCYGRLAFSAVMLLVTALFALPSGASGELVGKYAKFANCPYETPEELKCLYATTEGGEVDLGSTKIPIVNPVVLQGAYVDSDQEGISRFVGASDGETLSKAAQPVPGGLLGITAPDGSSPLVRAVVALLFENDLAKVNATLELAGPPSAIRFSEENFGGEIDTALKLPVKVHLENPFLGPSCYIGSSSSPIIWNLTSGTTAPPKPAKPMTGTVGEVEFLDGGRLTETNGTKLVDNAWAMPVATGCGGPLSSLINPVVNDSAGLPVPAGVSSAVLETVASLTPTTVVSKKASE